MSVVNIKEETTRGGGSNNPLARKISKVLETRLENDKDTLEALKELSSFFSENTLRTRRNLRGEIEKRSLTINLEFLKQLKTVVDSLEEVNTSVTSMNQACEDMMSRLDQTREQNRMLIEQTSRLKEDSTRLSMQEHLAQGLVKAFQLTPEEVSILRGGSGGLQPITPPFFTALERVQEIHRDCQVLLRTGRQVAALSIMEQMALYQEAGLERVYRWAVQQCRMSGSQELSNVVVKAMHALQDRPVLFRYVIDEYQTARRAELVRGFIDAMTCGGGPGSRPPIELYAHDPPRYVGDMLAWLHQAVPSEKEGIQTLLEECTKIELEETVLGVVHHVTEGVVRPLSVRVEQVVLSEPGAVCLYRLANLLRFYHQTIHAMVKEGPMSTCLSELQHLAQRTFTSALASQVAQLGERVEPPSSGGSLAPPPALSSAMTLLKDTLQAGGMVEHRKQDLQQIVDCVIDPFLQSLYESAARLGAVDVAVYLVNCLHHIHSTLSLYEFTDTRLEMLQGQMDAQIDTLVSEQASSMVFHLGLSTIYTGLQNQRLTADDIPPAMIQAFLGKLEEFLLSPDSLTLPQLALLSSALQRSTVRRRCMDAICSIYSQLYENVHNVNNGFTDPHTLMPRSPEQVRDLLV